MWHRFGPGFREAILGAVKLAEAEPECDLSTRHLLRALVAEHDAPASRILAAAGITPQAVREALEQITPGEECRSADPATLTKEAREALNGAYCLAKELDDQYIGSEHFLLCLLRHPESSDAGRVLAQLGASWQQAAQALLVQQKWRTSAPRGTSLPGLPARRLLRNLRAKAGQIKRLAYGLSQHRTPFMPYLLLRKRSTDNPYPLYTRLRSQPMYWDPLMGHWVVTRYQEVVAALAEPRLSQRIYSAPAWSHDCLPPLVQREFRCLQSSLDRQMLFQDAPDQVRQRALVSKRFSPRVIARMQEQMQQVADELLDAVSAAGGMEIIADLAVPFPLLVITRMLGLPASDMVHFKKWSQDYFKYLTFETSLEDDLAAYQSMQAAQAYFRALLPARRQLLQNDLIQNDLIQNDLIQDDLITLLLQADDTGEFLPEEEVVANCLLLLATGHENTTRLVSSGVLALMRCPEQWKKLCADPSLLSAAVEEMLRFDSPVQWTLRFLQEDTQWQGHALKKGQRVQIGIGPANRDPAQFPDAEQFDISRTENRHVAFGHGPHFCLGAALTRLEARIVFGCLITRFPHLHLMKSPEWRQEGLAFRSLQSLYVGWNKGSGED